MKIYGLDIVLSAPYSGCPWAPLDSQPQAVRPHNCGDAMGASAQEGCI